MTARCCGTEPRIIRNEYDDRPTAFVCRTCGYSVRGSLAFWNDRIRERQAAKFLLNADQHLIAHPATVAICGAAGEKAQLITARSEDLTFDMVPVLMRGLAVWGVERGGGRPSFAQGGGVNAALADVQAAVAAAVEAFHSSHP